MKIVTTGHGAPQSAQEPQSANTRAIAAFVDALNAEDKLGRVAEAEGSKQQSQRVLGESMRAIIPEHFFQLGKPDFAMLDILAMRRAVAWIIHSDALGQSVSEAELAPIMPDACRSWSAYPNAARAIIARLAEIVSAPDLDAALTTLAASEIAGIKVDA